MELQSGTHGEAIDRMVGSARGPDALKGRVDRRQEVLTKMAEMEEVDFLKPAPTGSSKAKTAGSRPAGIKTNASRGGTAEKTGVVAPASGKPPFRQGNSGVERGGMEQPQPGYLHKHSPWHHDGPNNGAPTYKEAKSLIDGKIYPTEAWTALDKRFCTS